MEITLIRHAQSEANAVGLWSGQGDTSLTELGVSQATRLAERVEAKPFDLVISSPLERAHATAKAFATEIEIEPDFQEIGIGIWDRLTREQVAERFPDEYQALMAGEDVRFGGQETLTEFDARVQGAWERLLARLDQGDRVAVVAHGGTVMAVLRALLGLRRRYGQGLGQIENSSLAVINFPGWRDAELAAFNDATHLAPLGGWASQRLADGDTILTLIRHGETVANLDQRWQGRTDGELTAHGHSQAEALADWYGGLDVLYSSPLQRARHTAQALAGRLGLAVDEHAGLIEMHMGAWEDLTTDQIRNGFPELWQRIFDRNEDLPRGGSGEAFGEVAARMQAALAELARRHAGARVGVVTHAGAVQAYLVEVIGMEHGLRNRLAFVENTAVSHVVVSETGARLADFNVAPHLG